LVFAVIWIAGCGGPKRLPPIVIEPPLPDEPSLVTPDLLGVGLLENEIHLEISTTTASELIVAADGRVLASLSRTDETVTCQRDGDDVVWQAAGQRGREKAVVLRPIDPAGRLRNGDQQFRGEFLVICAPQGRGLTLVNNVDLESYLKGVVPWEIGRHPVAKQAAVEAQAIAARTYTVSHWGARRHRGFDVFASVMDQVYKGSGDEDVLCNEAVDSTAGLVLTSDGEDVEAYYRDRKSVV